MVGLIVISSNPETIITKLPKNNRLFLGNLLEFWREIKYRDLIVAITTKANGTFWQLLLQPLNVFTGNWIIL